MRISQSPRARKLRTAPIDEREALFNEGAVGPIKHIQVATERITSVRGILLDIDPPKLRPGLLGDVIPATPTDLFGRIIAPMLQRHPVLAKGEVRNSGTGLHVILRPVSPIVLATESDQTRWAAIVRIIQGVMPIDAGQPGITACTRAVGSINSKNGAVVELLASGEGVTTEEILSLFEQMRSRPFHTIFSILTGADRLEPCPICHAKGSHLSALDRTGRCYGRCGSVSLAQLYDLALAPSSSRQSGAGDVVQ